MEDKTLKNLSYHLLVAVTTIVTLFSFNITNADALLSIVGEVGNNKYEISDNGQGDENPLPGIIDFHIDVPGEVIIIGTVLEEVTQLPNYQLEHTLTYTRTVSVSGTNGIDYSLYFESSTFSQPPIDTGTVHLEGTYHSLKGTIDGDASVSFEGFLNSESLAEISANFEGEDSPHKFAPQDIIVSFEGNPPPGPKTTLAGKLKVSHANPGDVWTEACSSSVSVISPIPEPSMEVLSLDVKLDRTPHPNLIDVTDDQLNIRAHLMLDTQNLDGINPSKEDTILSFTSVLDHNSATIFIPQGTLIETKKGFDYNREAGQEPLGIMVTQEANGFIFVDYGENIRAVAISFGRLDEFGQDWVLKIKLNGEFSYGEPFWLPFMSKSQAQITIGDDSGIGSYGGGISHFEPGIPN